MRSNQSKKRMWITLVAIGVLALALIVAGILCNLTDSDNDTSPKSNEIETPIDYFN